ncbi:hypothetical protein FIU86_05445 [Roseovarius sp. THAF9]|uniref:bacteriochlorophyll 4-vinyl reductase n=1 Tax=Roseovarius sp. THAF9 TaxID=2587847 RepID=UPI0012679B5F|nr:bacteriochlorophyll 4-vinyl reductase [Roseovarius sp. THAF9]QFT92276.1 hypothetical protein FIU86_05445 [Roseovarius sp. THAF9]
MAEPRVGPNAILQTMEALTELGGMDLTRRVFSAAGLLPLLEAPPSEMVPEVWASDLHRTITTELPAVEAARVAADGGHRTGFYILENRIPAVARTLLQLLPGSVAGSILLRAIERHAWTFAGSAEVAIEIGTPMYFFIYDNPLAIPGCPWHCAVFETLFRRLVSPHTRVAHTCCCANGADACVFEIDIRRGA